MLVKTTFRDHVESGLLMQIMSAIAKFLVQHLGEWNGRDEMGEKRGMDTIQRQITRTRYTIEQWRLIESHNVLSNRDIFNNLELPQTQI